MSAPNLLNIVKWKGELVKSPTDLSTAFPHGGTRLGTIAEKRFTMNVPAGLITDEVFGHVITEVIMPGESAFLQFTLRDFDTDAVSTIFPNTSNSGSTIDGLVAGASVNRPGYLMGNKAVVLMFSPDAVDDHKIVLFRNAIPMIQETAELQMKIKSSAVIPMVFYAAPDSSGRCFHVGLRSNLSV